MFDRWVPKNNRRLEVGCLRRSNSWSGDTRWERQIARHAVSHLRYDHKGQCFKYDLATGGPPVILADTEDAMQRHGIPEHFPNFSDQLQQKRLNELEQKLMAMQEAYESSKCEYYNLQRRQSRAPTTESAKYLHHLEEKMNDDKNTIKRLMLQNKNLKSSQRSRLDIQLSKRWLAKLPIFWQRFVVAMPILVACCLVLVTVRCVLDPVFRVLMFGSQLQSSTGNRAACPPRPDAAHQVARHGLVLPPWLSADWLSVAEMSVESLCPPRFPIVLRARNQARSQVFLGWLANNRTAALRVKELALAHGAVLFRGIADLSDKDFEDVMALLEIPPTSYTGSIGRRETVAKDGRRTFTTKYPADMVLMPHIEFGNKDSRPEFIAFYAKELPEAYGETPLVDFQAVWEQMHSQLKLKFAHGIRFTTRLYPDSFRWIWGDYASTWKGAFNTNDPVEAMRQCQAMSGVRSCFWSGDGSLVYVSEFPAVHFHKNPSRVAVLSTTFGFWNAELPLLALSRYADRLTFLQRLYAYVFMRTKFASTYCDPTPTRASFIDGSQLSLEESQHLSDLIWDHAVIFPSQKADMTLVDNTGTGHGRMNVGGSIDKRKIVSYIGGHFRVPSKIAVRIDFSEDVHV